MAKKYYAVRAGRNPGIYETWAECQRQVTGFSGAVFKSFPTREEAQSFVDAGAGLMSENINTKNTQEDTKEEKQKEKQRKEQRGESKEAPPKSMNPATQAVAYVDGSFDAASGCFSYGMVFFHEGREEHFCKKFEQSDLASMRNVAGEIKGAEAAMQYCLDHDIKSVTIYHDYTGIAFWCTGEWKAKQPGTQAYAAFYREAAKSVEIHFAKVKGHSGDTYNELADKLAKSALGIIPNL